MSDAQGKIARRTAADNLLSTRLWPLTGQLQRLEGMRHRQIRCGQIQEHRISLAVQFLAEAQIAHIPVIDGDEVGQSVSAEFIACLIRSRLVKIEGVQVASGLESAQEVVREGARAGARFNDHRTRTHLQLVQDHADIRRINNLSAMRQRLCPQFRRRLQDMGPTLGELHATSILHSNDIWNGVWY